MGFSSEVLRLDEELEGDEEATRVDWEPWVMMTRRGREALDLVDEARVEAIWGRAESYRSASTEDGRRIRLTPIPAAWA